MEQKSEKNKIAVITGGSRGLGKNMALALAKKGIDVLLTYNSNKEAALEVVSQIESWGQKAYALQLDTSKVKSFDGFISQVTDTLEAGSGSPNFDFLINNAGTGLYRMVSETSLEEIDEIIDIHYKGVFVLTQKALPFLNDGGSIINISSGLARMTLPGYSIYASIKAAVETLTRYLAKELGPRKIRVNVVAPGAIETDFAGGHTRDNKDINRMIANATALGRVGLPDDIGGVIAFLCTEDGRWINGQRLEVSGGQAL